MSWRFFSHIWLKFSPILSRLTLKHPLKLLKMTEVGVLSRWCSSLSHLLPPCMIFNDKPEQKPPLPDCVQLHSYSKPRQSSSDSNNNGLVSQTLSAQRLFIPLSLPHSNTSCATVLWQRLMWNWNPSGSSSGAQHFLIARSQSQCFLLPPVTRYLNFGRSSSGQGEREIAWKQLKLGYFLIFLLFPLRHDSTKQV